jgi:hypothetical protein
MNTPRQRGVRQGASHRPGESDTLRFFSIWLPLFVHLILSTSILFFTSFFVNGYYALAFSHQSRHQEGGLVLRASDITTLLSLSTKIMDYFRLSWVGMVAWRVVFILLEDQGLSIKHLSQYLSGLPARKRPRGKEWLAAVLFLFLIPQPFIEPLALGSVDWNFAAKDGAPVTIPSADPTAKARGWFWYLEQSWNRRSAIRTAGGMASRAWGAEDVQYKKNRTATRLGGTTCRHVMSGIAPVNSTLLDATIPCIEIHNITWAQGPVPNETAAYARDKAAELSLVDDPPFSYIRSGVSVLFSPGDTWDTPSVVHRDGNVSEADFPKATIWTGNMTVFVTLSRQRTNGCQIIAPNAFGDSSSFGQEVLTAFPANDNLLNETCVARGTVHFTAGVVHAPRSKFVTPQVVEYDPSTAGAVNEMSDGTIQPSIWTREALWLMPDTMTQVAVMNTSQLPTWRNLDDYTATLIRISYTANWDMLHALYEATDTAQLTVLPAMPRLRASVSFVRLYAWYGATLLVPLTGIILKYLHRSCRRGIMSDQTAVLFSDTAEVTKRYPYLTGMTILTKEDEYLPDIYIQQTRTNRAKFRFMVDDVADAS